MAPKRNAKFVLDIFASKISLLILGLLTAWLGYSVAKEAYRKHQVEREIQALKQEILELERKNIDLSSILDSFGDPKNIELEAKRRLNLKSPGEEVAVILRDKNDESQNIVRNYINENDSAVKDEGKENALLNPLKWWQYITNSK
ncbi:MAG: septum formation initiator family protein [Candidatus Spechtbacterales bacterium]